MDAAYAPFFQRYQFVEDALNTGLLAEFPRVAAWAKALLDADVVRGSVASNFADEYAGGLKRRGAYAAQYFEAT